jgi:hypothetical protein
MFGRIDAIWRASATGQPTDLDTEVAEAALTWARTHLPPESRPDDPQARFAPARPSPPDAPPSTRLATFTGRPPV